MLVVIEERMKALEAHVRLQEARRTEFLARADDAERQRLQAEGALQELEKLAAYLRERDAGPATLDPPVD